MILKKVLVMVLVALSVTFSVVNLWSCDVRADPDLPVHNIDTGINYATIQEAINANETSHGHVIQVQAGIYHEHVLINKSISLIGNDKSDTIIDGDGNTTVVHVKANNVSVAGFTVQNTTEAFAAIRVEESANATITDNIVRYSEYGIRLHNSRNTTVVRNHTLNNTYSGIYLFLSTGNTISDCNLTNNAHTGVFIFNSSNNYIYNNIFSKNKFGISVTNSIDNILYRNNISSSETGIQIISGSSKILTHCNNVSNSKTGIHLTQSSRNTIANNSFSSNSATGILLESSNNNVLLNNTLQDNTLAGVDLSSSSKNTLLFNNIGNSQYGIQLANSYNCTINENEAFNHSYGIMLSTSRGNSLWGNNIQANQYGIYFDNSSDNTLLSNNFINNTYPFSSTNSTNYLDNGAEGNYWSSYNGTDINQDAIGDTPYILAENNTDNNPLMGAFFHFMIHIHEETYSFNIISNSTVSEFQFDEATYLITFNVTGSGTQSFCRVEIPQRMISVSTVIVVDDKRANFTVLPLSNVTHQVLYFTYPLPAHQVTIVSEPYYDLLQKYNTLLAEYDNLNSTYNELSEVYTLLVANYDLLFANYTQLQANYDVLFANYTQLRDDYSKLQANFTQLQNNYSSLNMTYNQLTSNYDSLQNSYDVLLAQNASLTSLYSDLLTSYEDLQLKYTTAINEMNTTRNLVYILTATVVAVAATLFWINMRFRRKISEQDRIIQAYNPLEIARILFMDDVEKRGVKIGEFEKKHGIKIQPSNTLEDVLRELEKREKKTS